ncbi:lytic transglycosylase domain-containing protein [Nocardiopsis sp. YSL2]|uniref:aggregation-promoting factor C-terminal-like domain-containing protein n=1 Tax=Nocardiopsis sp. YSL2 TaxID=2939492 RepID=UPI0026F4592A|nr:lytic transglycosylase domain-containing protein [Nocardiopsis sp. YSL2]
MLLHRISLRHAGAIGAATLVAGTTFSVAAFARTGDADPGQVASAVVAAPTTPDAEAAEDDFFAAAPTRSEEDLAAAREESRSAAEAATAEAVQSSSGEGEDVPEPEPEPEPAESEDSSAGASGPSGSAAPVPAGSAKEIALELVLAEGWSSDQFSGCLEPLWEKESNWNHTAENPSSGAYGIPQSLPGSKMSSHGDDWRTNPATQIAWGIDYIKGRYGDPCGAWSHSQTNNWY